MQDTPDVVAWILIRFAVTLKRVTEIGDCSDSERLGLDLFEDRPIYKIYEQQQGQAF
jgi:hypothetical protein